MRPSAPMPEWRNWQTRRTQNPVPFTRRAGSTPASGTKKSCNMASMWECFR